MVMLVLISQPEPSGQSLRPREVGMTLHTLSDAASRPALGDLWPMAALFGDGGCVKHPPVPFLPYPEPSGQSFRPRKVGMTLRTLSARPVRSAAVQAARLD